MYGIEGEDNQALFRFVVVLRGSSPAIWPTDPVCLIFLKRHDGSLGEFFDFPATQSRERTMARILSTMFGIAFLLCTWGGGALARAVEVRVPIVVYHRFGPVVADSMTVTPREFAADIAWLKDNGYTVIPLRSLIDFLRRLGPPPPSRAVVITVDDGHRSVWQEMLPIVRQYGIPVTLFIYPSAISNATYALTWEQLAEMRATGLIDIQSHSYWHPNFKKEKSRLKPVDYQTLVRMQLGKSKSVLEQRLAGRVDLLAWPFGIHDEELEEEAGRAGYVAAFTIERRHVTGAEEPMALPRYLMVSGHSLRRIVDGR